MISVRADVEKLKRSLSAFWADRLPFAAALALNATAKKIADAEQAYTVWYLTDRQRA